MLISGHTYFEKKLCYLLGNFYELLSMPRDICNLTLCFETGQFQMPVLNVFDLKGCIKFFFPTVKFYDKSNLSYLSRIDLANGAYENVLF